MTITRRHVVASAAALPALAMPAIAGHPKNSPPDPIIAAIERHRCARADAIAAWDLLSDCHHQLYSDPPPRSTEDYEAEREWHARELEATNASGRQDDIALDLLHTQPTTVAGAAALLSYYVEAVGTDKQFFPENLDEDGNKVDAADIGVDDSPPAFSYLLARNVASALAQIAVRS